MMKKFISIFWIIAVSYTHLAKFDIAADASKEETEAFVRSEFANLWEGKEIVKFIVVPGRIVNIVVK